MERSHIYAATAFMVTATGYCLFFLLNDASAQENGQDTSFYSLFEQSFDECHNEQFEEAIQLATQIRELYPDQPAGAFGLLTTYQTIMRNYRVRTYEAKFDSLLDLTIELSKDALKKNKKEGLNYFYLGCAYGSRSIYYARRGQWMDAFKDGSRVSSSFKKAIAYKPDFYDSYYGLGLYQYWLYAKAKLLRILSLVKDQRHEGIEYIKLASEKGHFLKIQSMYGLTSVYYNEGEYEKALQVSDRLYEKFPNNPSLLYRRGRIYQELGQWSKAKQVFENLCDVLKVSKYQSISYQIECLYQIAKCQYHLGNYLDTQRLCQEAIALEKYCDFSKEIDGPLETFSEIKDQLHKLNEEIKELRLTEAKGKIVKK